MKVTAVILTYDRLALLRQAVASALWQTHEDLEVLIVCNGAGPDTLEWVHEISDPRVIVVEIPENISPSLARNEGMAKASGEWIANLDDDDVWAPDKVASMLAAATTAGRLWVYCGVVYIDPQGAVIGGRPLPDEATVLDELPVAYTIPGGLSGVMWHRDGMPDGGMMDDLPYTGDWDMALRLAAAGLPARVDRPLVGYRQHPGSWSRGVNDDRDEFDYVIRKHASSRGRRRAHWGEHYRYVAAHASRAGERGEAMRLYGLALAHLDWKSIPRMLGAMLPPAGQTWLRMRLLSDRSWMAEAETWLERLRVTA